MKFGLGEFGESGHDGRKVALWFGTLETRGVFWPDEGRYAEIAREMVASGDYVTPRLNGVK